MLKAGSGGVKNRNYGSGGNIHIEAGKSRGNHMVNHRAGRCYDF